MTAVSTNSPPPTLLRLELLLPLTTPSTVSWLRSFQGLPSVLAGSGSGSTPMAALDATNTLPSTLLVPEMLRSAPSMLTPVPLSVRVFTVGSKRL